jgi:pimeloyl-ACP methyl ester carboxylesterase
MRTEAVLCLSPKGYHRMVYHEWGHPDNDRVLVCAHGLARNSRDFDELAKALSRDYRVVCPDVVGRGESDWLEQADLYTFQQYLNDMMVLIGRIGVPSVAWLGTSMGGLIGMMLSAFPNSPIKQLVLNDIGPFVSHKALERIGQYLQPAQFDSLESVEAAMRKTYPALRFLTDEQWRFMARNNVKPFQDHWIPHYDPAIGEASRNVANQDVDLWAIWEMIDQPQMLIWGEASDVLEAETVHRMKQKSASLHTVSYPGIEHVPSLMEKEQIDQIQSWLRATSA